MIYKLYFTATNDYRVEHIYKTFMLKGETVTDTNIAAKERTNDIINKYKKLNYKITNINILI